MNRLKALILFVILTLAIHHDCLGQKKFVPEWNIGVGFGSTMSSASFQGQTSRQGISTKTYNQYHGGLAIRYIGEKNLGVIAELNYAQNGWIQEFKDNPEFAHSHQLNYLEMPILTHIYFGNKVRFMINLGPKISYLLSDSEEINDALKDHLASGNVDVNTPTYQYYHLAEKKIDYGIMGGAGLEFRSAIGNLALEGRYYFGLSDFYRNSKADYFGRSANRVISVKLTYYTKLF